MFEVIIFTSEGHELQFLVASEHKAYAVEMAVAHFKTHSSTRGMVNQVRATKKTFDRGVMALADRMFTNAPVTSEPLPKAANATPMRDWSRPPENPGWNTSATYQPKREVL